MGQKRINRFRSKAIAKRFNNDALHRCEEQSDYPVSMLSTSRYFSLVFLTTSSGSMGAGGR